MLPHNDKGFLWPEMIYMCLDNMQFQQDGTRCHTANETMTFYSDKSSEAELFHETVIPSGCQDCEI